MIKLSSGEEILTGKCDFDEQGGYVLVNNPYYVLKSINQEGTVSCRLEKWMPYTKDEDFPVDFRQIVTYNGPSSDFYEYYLQIVNDDLEEERNYVYGEDYSGQVH